VSATRTAALAEPARQPDRARGAEPGAYLNEKRNMLVATYNIHRGLGSRPAGPFRPDRAARVVAEIRPDLIALQEAQHYLRPSAGMLDAETIERDLGLRLLRVTGRPGEQGWRGNLVLVRHDAEILRPPVGLRLGGLEPRGGVMAELDLGWGPFRLLAVHLSLGAARRRLQAKALLEAMETGAGKRLPTLLLGDLNDWRPGASALGALEAVFGEPPRAPTFPSVFPVLSPDRIMGHPRGLVPAVEAHDTPLARRASDHLPLKARLNTAALEGARASCGGGHAPAPQESAARRDAGIGD
jgi:endonuclease/exonuclease/phosphatase family metal-dependent hydrolase